MHKKLEADLTSLAHSILQMKNKEDVFALKDKAYAVYEKLAVLAYVEEYINNTPNPSKTKEEILEKIESVVEETKIEIVEEAKETVEDVIEDVVEEKVDEVIDVKDKEEEKEVEDITDVPLEGNEVAAEKGEEPLVHFLENDVFEAPADKDDVKNVADKKVLSLEEELRDTIPVDVVADLFENAPKKSLNDKLQGDIQIGLNDRIAFVKNLFDGSQEDFNRVVSQLNTIKTEKEAKKFIHKMVKPDYDWTDKEELEERFISIVERKFL